MVRVQSCRSSPPENEDRYVLVPKITDFTGGEGEPSWGQPAKARRPSGYGEAGSRIATRVGGGGVGADGLTGLGQVRGARLVEDRGGAQECAVGSPVARAVGEVGLEEEVGLVNPDTPYREQPDLLVDASRTTPLKKKTTAAKALCTRCPLSDACTDHAIANEPSRSSSRAA
ncbi:WhiB family transcriptional regulator [Streptomyces sp. IBSBF 3352]|uniref:WhiB family transcriptional regulator n=1 Tax=Streptomyces sp. IBSBF 3352 TaxID=2903523 RepID=UPI002FDBC603